jgi:acyltransferase
MEPSTRIAWLDVARGYGMFLVFYGHLAEQLSKGSFPEAFEQFKFIYSFHMPMFFVFAGLLAPTRPGAIGALRHGLLTRILPAIFFNLLIAAMWLPPSPWASTPIGQQVGTILLKLLSGHAEFNFLTWFLFCLFAVDLLHVALRRLLRSDGALALSIVVFFVVGQYMTFNLKSFSQLTGIPANFWMIHEAVVALGFHQIGYLLKRRRILEGTPGKGLLLAVSGATWLTVGLTFQLNHGPFTWPQSVVLMSMSSHGNSILFPLTALAGTAAIISLAMLLPALAPARWIGRNSLGFLGLNAFFYVFGNSWIAPRIAPYMQDSALLQIGISIVATVVCLGLTAPCVAALNHSLPQLVGRPKVRGPLLPALERQAERTGDLDETRS